MQMSLGQAQQQVHPSGRHDNIPRTAFEKLNSSTAPHGLIINVNNEDNDNHEMFTNDHGRELPARARGVKKTVSIDPSNEKSLTDEGQQFDPTHGCYFLDGVRRIDFVLTYKEPKADTHVNTVHARRREFFLKNLKEYGEHRGVGADVELETEQIRIEHDVINFVKVHIPFPLLCYTADQLKIEKPLKLHDKPVFLRKYKIGFVLNRFFNCYYCTRIGKETPNEDEAVIYYPFDKEDEYLFNMSNKEKFFSHTQRHECAWEILQSVRNHPEDDKMRGIEGLVEHKIFNTAYPCHDPYSDDYFDKLAKKPETARQKLEDNWANWRSTFTLQPLHQIRRYFGERIGFYFAFMDFYTKQLGIPTLAGIIVFIIGMTSAWQDPEVNDICNKTVAPGNFLMCPICRPPDCEAWPLHEEGCSKYKWEFALDNEATVALSCIVMFWAIMFLKLWRRREASLASEWNVFHVKTHDAGMRPEYEERAKTTRTNPVTLKTEPHIPYHFRTLWIVGSIIATFLVLCVTGACLAGLVVSRIALYGAFRKGGGRFEKHNVEYARWFVHFLIFVLVTVTEKIYFKIGLKLTLLECPRTHHQYMGSLLWKLFVFQLINELIPLSYAAWLKGKTVATPIHLNAWTEICDGGCMGELVELVFVLLFFRLVLGNALEIGIPFIKNCIKRFRTKKVLGRHSSYPQFLKDYYLNEVELDGVYEEYMEMMVQFMFVVCFIPAFPLAPLVCLMNNIIEIRLDATKLLQTNRRPLPMRVPGIQIWNTFLELIVKLGILINAGLIAFTSDVVPRLYYQYNRADFSHSGTRTHAGYTEYSLSYVNISDYNGSLIIEGSHHPESHTTEKSHHRESRMKEESHHYEPDRCYYPGFREANSPFYDHKYDYWRIATIRVVAFAIYAVVFFVIMWFINLVIPDVAGRTRLKLARQSYLTKHYMNTERRRTTDGHTAASARNIRRRKDRKDDDDDNHT